MICPSCSEGELRVTNTYRATESASTRSKVCLACGERFTEVLCLSPARRRGEGAAAIASALKREAEKEGAADPETDDSRSPSHKQEP